MTPFKRIGILARMLGTFATVLLISRYQGAAEVVKAISDGDFLNSIGTMSAISVRGENFQKTIECTKYLGVRWLREGIEGNVPIQQYVELHQKAGVRFSWGLGSGG
ncbi:MAG TPA: glycosyl hydrolase, partial [Verrucomicrobiae bacterium]|nr:glycosyl hydrolase [Verrucomicrobiae bacterium]